jgi:Pyridoxamine 5'-phosphate oxidase
MAGWQEFRAADRPFAELAESRIEGPGLVLVGTLRRNGWPRISPVEPLIVEGVLYLGMMWQSKKAADLLRDPRCTVHSIVQDTAGTEGDVKVYGRAVEVADPDERERYCRALESRIGWRPDGAFHLFAVDITAVGYFVVGGEGHETRTWTAPNS